MFDRVPATGVEASDDADAPNEKHAAPATILAGLSNVADGAATIAVVLLMTVLVAVMFAAVIYRYVLNDALAWSEEVAGFAMGWLVFLGAAVLFRRDGHPSSRLLQDKASPAIRKVIEQTVEILVGIYLVVLIAAGVGILSTFQPHSPALSLPYGVAYVSIPISGVIMIVHWLARLRERVSPPSMAIVVLMVAALGGGIVFATGANVEALQAVPLWLLWLSLPVAFFLGVPIALVLGLGATLFITVSGTVPLSIVAQRAYAGIDNPSFLAIPAFMLTGALMLVTGMSDGLVVFASAVVGRFRGGLALADVLASVLFADISGSAVADTAAIGATLMPGMVKRGYDRDFVAAHQAAAGSLGTLFPPSISMIIFATVTSVSVTGLFLGSIVPGLLVAASYMMIAYLVARYRNYPREPGVGLPDLGKCFIQALPALVAPVVVLGGILLGVFTPYEAGAVAAVYVAVVGGLLRPRSTREYVRAFVDGAKTAAMVLFIIANASILAWVLVGQQVPQEAALFVSSLTHHPVMIMLLVSVLLIALSIFLEPPAILITVVPVLLPVVTEAGVSDLQFGVIVMLTGAIGMLLPPIGITLLVSVSIIQSSIERAARAAIPYVLVACADLGLVILFPTLTSWLPKFLGH